MGIERIGIVSDTHGVVEPPVLEVIAGCDLVVHAGDIGGAAVLDALRDAAGGEVVAVLGNNDVAAKWPPGDGATLDRLEEMAFVDLAGGRIAIEHGHRIHDTKNYHRRLRARHAGARLVVYGHTHVRAVDTEQRPWVVNPGAAGRERTHGGPSCLVLDAGADEWRIEAYRFELAPRRRRASA